MQLLVIVAIAPR